MGDRVHKPAWLKSRLPAGKKYLGIREIVEINKLHTICTSGHCPNLAECWGRGTATLMILGDVCTRSCRFCNVKTGKPGPADEEEPGRVAETVQKMGVKHCVITSVDRDDLPDKGSGLWASTILRIKEMNPQVTIEALIPDFDGNPVWLQKVMDTAPEVISHNLETVERLTPLVRSRAGYRLSLEVIRYISGSGIRSKSGIMAGLGETEEEVYRTMDDLRRAGCEVFTIGQYLQPTKKHLEVSEYVPPERFEKYRLAGLDKGFRHVESAPLVRSSYHAEKHIL
ncbi:MAG: lipoyl synthase [Bacteroidales bacterium]|nr:lipoyl synthase [Bacteroidales bacterium]